jgi:cholest-4-en-3-one 26-monooxygenase
MDDLADVDVLDPALHADGPPHALFARMREEEPVRWNPTGDGGGFWSVTRHEDVERVSKDPATFSSHAAGIFLNPDQVVPLDLTRNLLLYKDPPDHTKYRKIMQTAFVPNTVNALEDDIRARITGVIDAIAGRGEADFVTDVAVPVPLGVLAEMMGLPDEDMDQMFRWTAAIEAAQLSTESAAATDTFVEMGGYLHGQVARQIEEGGTSLVTRLREAEVDGERLTDDEILVFFALLVFAGNDTTRNTASSGLLALMQHREQWELLCREPERIPNAVEEMLRWTSVVNYFCRTATEDTELGGCRIAAGDKVMIWYTSASRDEAAASAPDTFDVTRERIDHKAFGGGGRHFCLGAGLARLELRVLFEELTRRLPALELAGAPERLPSAWANALTGLPVRF